MAQEQGHDQKQPMARQQRCNHAARWPGPLSMNKIAIYIHGVEHDNIIYLNL